MPSVKRENICFNPGATRQYIYSRMIFPLHGDSLPENKDKHKKNGQRLANWKAIKLAKHTRKYLSTSSAH